MWIDEKFISFEHLISSAMFLHIWRQNVNLCTEFLLHAVEFWLEEAFMWIFPARRDFFPDYSDTTECRVTIVTSDLGVLTWWVLCGSVCLSARSLPAKRPNIRGKSGSVKGANHSTVGRDLLRKTVSSILTPQTHYGFNFELLFWVFFFLACVVDCEAVILLCVWKKITLGRSWVGR